MMNQNNMHVNPVDIENIETLAEEIVTANVSKEDLTFSARQMDCIIVIDKSGSMTLGCETANGQIRTKYEVAVDNAEAFLRKMKNHETLSQVLCITVAVFSSEEEVICKHVRAADLDVDELMAKLRAISPRGTTALGKTIIHMVDLLNARKEWMRNQHMQYYQPCLCILTDGLPTSPETGKYSEQTMSQAYHLIDGLLEGDENGSKITVLPVGIGDSETSDEEFKVLARLIKKDGDAGIPVLRNGQDFSRYFRYVGQTVMAIASGNADKVDFDRFTREFLSRNGVKYEPRPIKPLHR